MTLASSEVYGEALPDTLPTIWHRFSENAEKHSDELALVCTHQSPDLYSIPSVPLKDDEYRRKPYLRWTYKSLKYGIDRLANALRVNGAKPGTPVVSFLQNSVEFVLTMWATHQIGCVFAPINPRNFSNKDEVSHMLKTVSISADGQPLVLIAGNGDLAEQIDLLPGIKAGIKIVTSDSPLNGWISFKDLLEQKSTAEDPVMNETAHEGSGEFIHFTSGTTSLPKGCLLTSEQANAWVQIRSEVNNATARVGDKFCSALPNNHCLGSVALMSTFYCGGAVVFPGPAFDPDAMFSTLYLEQCTHTCLVPIMVHALLGVKATHGYRLQSLKNIWLSGAACTPEALRHCIEELGSSGIENCYGMTEGLIVSTGSHSDPTKLIRGDDVTVGWVLKGTALKICAPGEIQPLAKGAVGELHFSGLCLGNGYIGKASSDLYTDAQGKTWFVTGDQAIIDDDGRLFIVGRYKEMIIRGGENIAPTAIEMVLGQVPRLASLQIQIVGAPDTIAGEVPVAVARGTVDSEVTRELQETVIKRMGTIYVPDEVIPLEALGLDDYPRTMAGKIQKTKLAELVRKYRSDRDKVSTNVSDNHLEETVRGIWARAIGREPQDLPLSAQISDFADSILLMRVRDRIRRETGKSISLAEMDGAGTLASQIKLLAAQSAETKAPEQQKLPQRQGPPGIEDMAHLIEDLDLFDVTKDVIEKSIGPYGLEWNDVADVMPAYDFATVMASTGIYDSWNFKIVWVPNNKLDAVQVRTALELVLKNNPMLASFLVWDEKELESDIALHVTIKHGRKLLDKVIEDAGSLKTLEELEALTLKYPYPRHATFPGPLFRALIYYVEESESYAVLYNVNHSVIDASYGQIIAEDFDNALNNGTTQLHSHTDYKLWADSYHSLGSSPTAKAATKWHIKRLKDLETHRKAIFPPIPQRASWDPALEANEEDGFQYSFEATGLSHLRMQHRGITAPIALKSAVALLNTYRTGHTHALFSNLEAARTTFPFVPKSLESQFEATDVAGPTIESVINLVEVRNDENAIDFLQRMQDDQTNLTKYASAPWKDIISALGSAGDLVPIVTQAQIFNWVPGIGTTNTDDLFSNFKVLKAVVRPAVGISINAGLGSKENSTMFLYLRGDGFDMKGFQQMAWDLEKVFKWVLKEENWGRGVGEFVECFEG